MPERTARLASSLSLTVVFAAGLIAATPQTGAAAEPTPDAESLEKAFPGKPLLTLCKQEFPQRVFWGDTHLHTRCPGTPVPSVPD